MFSFYATNCNAFCLGLGLLVNIFIYVLIVSFELLFAFFFFFLTKSPLASSGIYLSPVMLSFIVDSLLSKEMELLFLTKKTKRLIFLCSGCVVKCLHVVLSFGCILKYLHVGLSNFILFLLGLTIQSPFLVDFGPEASERLSILRNSFVIVLNCHRELDLRLGN